MELRNLKIEELSTEQKIGMLLCARRCYNNDDLEFTLSLIRDHALGCVQVPTTDKAPSIMKAVKNAADYPILIIADMEKGYSRSELPLLPAMTLAACDNGEYYRAFAKGIVATAKAEGFNGTWGPIVDILRCDGPCRIERHFGDTPKKVLKAAEEISKIFKEYGFISTGKHYPGGDDTPFDTHMTEGISGLDEKELLDFDLVPYLELMKKGLLPSIMTRHCIFPKIDPEFPASASQKVIDIIRKQGFDGVAFTDSLAMMGILQKYGEENILGMCIAAGNDIVLPNYRTPTKNCYELLLKNYRDGMFSEERLNEAVRRVLALQSFVNDTYDKMPTLTERDRECLSLAARDCITAVTDEGVKAALGDIGKKRLFVIVTDQGFDADSPTEEIQSGKWYYPKKIAAKIKEEFPNSRTVFVPEFASVRENENVLLAATEYDEVVFVTFCITAPYLGTDCLTRRTEALINCLIRSDKVSAVVHFGNPYAVQPINHVPRIIFGYTAPESQNYAIEVLSGKIPARGKLPFEVKLNR